MSTTPLGAGHVRLPGIDGTALAYHDYGLRKWDVPRAIVFHGSESVTQGATVNYLKKEHGPNPNGVSATFVVQRDGTIIQMLGLNHLSGTVRPVIASSGPRLCTTEQGYYGYSHAKYALADRWGIYVNHAILSVETDMVARSGPEDAVIDGWVRLWKLANDYYHQAITCPLGHNDFAGCYKSCPGFTDRVKRAFTGMGGHGKDYKRVPAPAPAPVPVEVNDVLIVEKTQLRDGSKWAANTGDRVIALKLDAKYQELSRRTVTLTGAASGTVDHFISVSRTSGTGYVGRWAHAVGGQFDQEYIGGPSVTEAPVPTPPPAPAPDVDAAVAAAVAAQKATDNAALAAAVAAERQRIISVISGAA